jgi:hypothetical protein
MKKDWLSLTEPERAKMLTQLAYISWENEGFGDGPIWMNLKNGTKLSYQKSRFNPKEAKWFPRQKAVELSQQLKVTLKTA